MQLLKLGRDAPIKGGAGGEHPRTPFYRKLSLYEGSLNLKNGTILPESSTDA